MFGTLRYRVSVKDNIAALTDEDKGVRMSFLGYRILGCELHIISSVYITLTDSIESQDDVKDMKERTSSRRHLYSPSSITSTWLNGVCEQVWSLKKFNSTHLKPREEHKLRPPVCRRSTDWICMCLFASDLLRPCGLCFHWWPTASTPTIGLNRHA